VEEGLRVTAGGREEERGGRDPEAVLASARDAAQAEEELSVAGKREPSSSPNAAVQPPRSNPLRRSSSGPPGPWYTPSRLSIIEATSFMVVAPCE